MAEFQQVQNMLDAQSAGIDPFTQARSQAQSTYSAQQNNPLASLNAQMAQAFGFQQAGSPAIGSGQQLFQQSQAQPVSAQGAPTESQAQPSGNTLFKPVNGAQTASFGDSKLPGMLQQMGVDDKGLAFNPLGRVQLMTRLQNKFGANFTSNANALNVLNAFDDHTARNPNAQQELTQAISSGQRTLASLFGGNQK